jgi:hypothetical protein
MRGEKVLDCGMRIEKPFDRIIVIKHPCLLDLWFNNFVTLLLCHFIIIIFLWQQTPNRGIITNR